MSLAYQARLSTSRNNYPAKMMKAPPAASALAAQAAPPHQAGVEADVEADQPGKS